MEHITHPNTKLIRNAILKNGSRYPKITKPATWNTNALIAAAAIAITIIGSLTLLKNIVITIQSARKNSGGIKKYKFDSCFLRE
jgi:hypothetical protein